MSGIVSTCLTVILDSNSGIVELNYPVGNQVVLNLTNVMISFADGAKSIAAGSIIYLDLGELTSHTSLNGNLDNNQVLVLTNDISTSVTSYTPFIPIGLDKSIPTRFNYQVLKPDGTSVANLTSIVLQFSYSFLAQ